MDRKIKIGIKKAREKLGISQIELASKLKIDLSVLKGWEAGAAFPSLEIIKNLTNILNVSSEMLIFSEERKPLNIAELDEESKTIVINFYKKVRNS